MAQAKELQLHIDTLSGPYLLNGFTTDDAVLAIKELAQRTTGTPAKYQVILLGVRILEDDTKLGSLSSENSLRLQLLVHPTLSVEQIKPVLRKTFELTWNQFDEEEFSVHFMEAIENIELQKACFEQDEHLLPSLLRLSADHPHAFVRAGSVRALGNLSLPGDEQVVQVLLGRCYDGGHYSRGSTLMKSFSRPVALAAVEAIAKVCRRGDSRCLRTLSQVVFGIRSRGALLTKSTTVDLKLITSTLKALQILWADDDDACNEIILRALLYALQDNGSDENGHLRFAEIRDDPRYVPRRNVAAGILSDLAIKLPFEIQKIEVLSMLAKQFGTSHRSLRDACFNAFVKAARSSLCGFVAVEPLLVDAERRTRRVAMQILDSIIMTPQIVPASGWQRVLTRLRDSDTTIRIIAARLLFSWFRHHACPNPQDILHQLRTKRRDPSLKVRKVVQDGLQSIVAETWATLVTQKMKFPFIRKS